MSVGGGHWPESQVTASDLPPPRRGGESASRDSSRALCELEPEFLSSSIPTTASRSGLEPTFDVLKKLA
jgi:hypothetical protein